MMNRHTIAPGWTAEITSIEGTVTGEIKQVDDDGVQLRLAGPLGGEIGVVGVEWHDIDQIVLRPPPEDPGLLDRMLEKFAEVAERFPGDYDVELTSDERFVLVEQSMHAETFWLTPGRDLVELLADSAGHDEALVNWRPVTVVDLIDNRWRPVNGIIDYEGTKLYRLA